MATYEIQAGPEDTMMVVKNKIETILVVLNSTDGPAGQMAYVLASALNDWAKTFEEEVQREKKEKVPNLPQSIGIALSLDDLNALMQIFGPKAKIEDIAVVVARLMEISE